MENETIVSFMTLPELYRRSVVYPAIILLPVSIVIAFIENHNYKSEWLTSESVIGMTIMVAFIYCLIVCILALTIFLNRYRKIRSNLFLSALSWFLLPGGFILLVIGKAINEYATVESESEIIYALIFNVPFIIGLAWGFVKYRKTKDLV
jgi:uncharacterized membrane protein YhaH (DUF805 family)